MPSQSPNTVNIGTVRTLGKFLFGSISPVLVTHRYLPRSVLLRRHLFSLRYFPFPVPECRIMPLGIYFSRSLDYSLTPGGTNATFWHSKRIITLSVENAKKFPKIPVSFQAKPESPVFWPCEWHRRNPDEM